MENSVIVNKMNEVIEKNNFSGVVSIRKQGEIIYESAVGFRDRSNALGNNIETKFGIASGTKIFTALAIGRLIEEEKISLETRVFDVIENKFPLYSKEITIQHLLTHTSGIPDYYDEEKIDANGDFNIAIPWYELKEPMDYLPIFPQEKMKFAPGESFSYCNSGFVLLAAIISEISEMPYKDYIEKNIFKANGMSNSGFYALNKLPENTAIGYIEECSWHTNVYNLPIVGGGDGGAFSTITDLYMLWDALLDNKILSKDLTELYIKPYVKAESEGPSAYYGHGVWIYKGTEGPGEEYITGYDPGISFKSTVIREKDVVYTVISNTAEGAWPIISQIEKLSYDE